MFMKKKCIPWNDSESWWLLHPDMQQHNSFSFLSAKSEGSNTGEVLMKWTFKGQACWMKINCGSEVKIFFSPSTYKEK